MTRRADNHPAACRQCRWMMRTVNGAWCSMLRELVEYRREKVC